MFWQRYVVPRLSDAAFTGLCKSPDGMNGLIFVVAVMTEFSSCY